MPYIDPESGITYSHPSSKQRAKELRDHLYSDANSTCKTCGRKDPLRYVENDQCYSCLIEGHHGVNWFRGHLEGTQFWTQAKGCRGGPHLVKYHKDSKTCATCEELKEARGKSPRQRAIEAGESWYLPLEPCDKCGKLEFKRVHDGKCLGCIDTNIRAPSPRQAAIEAGEDWYMPDIHCAKCGLIAEKRVGNGECKGCNA